MSGQLLIRYRFNNPPSSTVRPHSEDLQLLPSDLATLQEHYLTLSTSLALIEETLEEDHTLTDFQQYRALRNALKSARKSNKFFHRIVQDLMSVVPVLERTSSQSVKKAQEVFDTPELLERILSELDTREKLSAMTVQKTWLRTVLASVKLKRGLGLANSGDDVYSSPFSRRDHMRVLIWDKVEDTGGVVPNSFPGGGCYVDVDSARILDLHFRPEMLAEWHNCRLKISLSFHGRVRRPGRRICSMRICSPAIKIMRVRVYPGPRELEVTSESAEGFTVGEVLRYTNALFQSDYGADCVLWDTTLKLCPDDPIHQSRHDRKQEAIDAFKKGPPEFSTYSRARPPYRIQSSPDPTPDPDRLLRRYSSDNDDEDEPAFHTLFLDENYSDHDQYLDDQDSESLDFTAEPTGDDSRIALFYDEEDIEEVERPVWMWDGFEVLGEE